MNNKRKRKKKKESGGWENYLPCFIFVENPELL
jgi:hypothetical protein